MKALPGLAGMSLVEFAAVMTKGTFASPKIFSVGSVAPEQYPPTTATTPCETSLVAALTDCCGSQASSATTIASCLPKTPPALLISAWAMVTAFAMSWP